MRTVSICPLRSQFAKVWRDTWSRRCACDAVSSCLMTPTIPIWAVFGYFDFGVSDPANSGFKNPMSPATIAPMTERYSSENWVACHDARNAMRPNEMGFGKLVIPYFFLMTEPSMGLQRPQRNGRERFGLLGVDEPLNSSLSLPQRL